MKQTMNEADTRAQLINPALDAAGWNMRSQVRMEYPLTKGRIIPQGRTARRENPKYADYVLFYKRHLPLAVIEAKKIASPAAEGIQQALEYADMLDAPFVFASNGKTFVFHDKTISDGMREKELPLSEFPSPQELWGKYQQWKNWDAPTKAACLQDYYEGDNDKKPRYYQQTAINRVVEKIASGANRALLVMATGTGKTHTAFQIIWRLRKCGKANRVLFLADRDALIRQTQNNDFRPFGGAMARLGTKYRTIDTGKAYVDPSYEIYLSLYQSITGPEAKDKAYKLFSPGFFDLIVVDECHRGSVEEDSAWREILEYFSSAVHLGMTATPKETKYTSNIIYFGDPIFSYSLKQGIADGFLAPYKVIRVHLDRDVDGYRPVVGQTDRDGDPVPDQVYLQSDFDRKIVLSERERIVAKKISDYLRESGDRMQKTIIFCIDAEHAIRLRQALVNENSDLCDESPRYVMRIMGDYPQGYEQLDNFQDPESRYPTLAVTSRLLATGVDVPTCRLLVIDKTIRSLTEFKQILGRGTRLHDDSGKMYFTLMDFRQATHLFADPNFDGEPVMIYEPTEDESIYPPDELVEDSPPSDESDEVEHETPPNDTRIDEDLPLGIPPTKKIYVDGVSVKIVGEMVEFLGEDGKLVKENLAVYGQRCVLNQYANVEDFRRAWSAAAQRRDVLQGLEKAGLPLLELTQTIGDNLDPFDLICQVAFGHSPQTRKDRAARARHSEVYARQGEKARQVLDVLLMKYLSGNVDLFDTMEELQVPPISEVGQPSEVIGFFGGREHYQKVVRELQDVMYAEAA